MFEPFSSDFKTILTGSSFLGLRSSVFVLYSPFVVGCFVTVTAVEAKAEKAVDFTCTKSAVGGLGAIRLNLEMKQLFAPFGGDNTIAFFFASRARSIDPDLFFESLF